jgi:ATP-binding cassette subfamily B protein
LKIVGRTIGIGGLRRRFGFLPQLLRMQREFAPYIRAHRAKLVAAIVLSVLYAGVRLLEPWPLQILFDEALLGKHSRFLGIDPLAMLGGDRMALLVASAGAVLGIALLSGTIYYAQSLILAAVGQDIVRELRQDLFHQMQRLSLSFHRKATSGDLLMRLTGDMVMLRDMILASLVTLTTQTLLLVSVLILMATVSLQLTIISILLAPLLYLLFRFFRRRMIEAARSQRRREGRLASSLEEVLLSVQMIQSYTAEQIEDERFRQLCKRSARAGLKAARLEAGMQRMVEVLIAVATALVIFFGVREVLQGRLTPGVLLVFLAYLRALYRPVRGFSKVAERTARASAASERVMEVLNAPREIKNSRNAIPAPPLRGEIEFDHVSYTYQDGTQALRDVSFRIPKGQRVALVGPTGAGKSTLLSLLLRFHKPTQGQVLIDRSRIKMYTLESLRKQITFLGQEPFILGTTVRDNLLYGKPDANDGELWAALDAAGLGTYVRTLPGALDAPLQSRGVSLSGGQKQRLEIARALLKAAPILLLDEPTTGLDARSEEEVLSSIERLRGGRTTITIAHRFHTVRTADRVLVLNQGALVEDGTPGELIGEASLFRLLAEIQGFDLRGAAFAPPADRDASHPTVQGSGGRS